MDSKKLYYILKSVWMVVILLVMLIFMNRDYTDISAKKEQEEENSRLNIALVNEDAGVRQNNTDYNLGADYVKKIEKDVTYNWFTVSRGIAENGLKNGTYNLLVTIPSNFSSKLLDLDSPAPEKVRINYKINANGNATLENESKSVGRKIVNDLNQQLVDLYVVSILDNLFTAQQNIEKVYKNQSSSVQEFQDVLYQPTLNFKDYLPAITSQSKNALQANNLLATSLIDSLKNPESLLDGHQEFSTLLEQLLKQRAEGKLTYEDFVSILMSMDDNLLSSETNTMYSTLESLNQSLQEDFVASDNGNGRYIQQMNELNEQLLTSKETIDKQIVELEEIEDKYFDTYSSEFFKQFRIYDFDEASKVTFRQVLSKMDYDNSQLSNVANFNANYLKKMQERLDSLPFKQDTNDINDFNEVFLYGHLPYTNEPAIEDIRNTVYGDYGMLNKIEQINQKIQEINDHYPDNPAIAKLEWKVDSDTINNSQYYKDLRRAYDRLVRLRDATLTEEKHFTIDTANFRTDGSISFGNIPPTLTLVNNNTDTVISSQTELPITSDSMRFTYTYNSDFDETADAPAIPITVKKILHPDQDGEAVVTRSLPSVEVTTDSTENTATEETAATEESTQTTEEKAPAESISQSETYVARTETSDEYTVSWDQTADVSEFLTERYQYANRKYAEQLGKTIELYDTVNAELKEFDKYPFDIFNNLLDLNMTDMFKQVLNGTFATGHYKEQHEKLNSLKLQAADIDRQSENIGERLQNIQASTMTLNENVQAQINNIEYLRKTMSEANEGQTKVAADNLETDTEISAVETMLASVKSQAEQVKASSETNAKEAENVKSVFTSFDEEVNTAQKNGEELSSNADVIMDNLNKELANNNDFVSAFIKVLNNAQKDGVPNNTLLEFIANPVNGKAEATIKTTEINEPFTWILIMYTLSLFVAYLFTTQPLVRKVKDKFKREQLWFKDNVMETIMLTASAVGIGLVLGILSISELQIVKESQIVWVMMVVLFMLIFSLLNHYALKQFHIAGFGFSLFLFISYVFVTNAIGKTKGNNPMVDLIRSINPLSIGENNLADILANNALNIVHIILYLLAIAALFAFNIFIWRPRRKIKEVVK
ncbi:type VII secretion protein EsaA [Erwinia sp. CPCC 100877]|nr:type VII secretion protein EsaA [Erwinia sp. CPCC 100877]